MKLTLLIFIGALCSMGTLALPGPSKGQLSLQPGAATTDTATTVSAGPNQSICSDTTTLHATNPGPHIGLWEMITGVGTIVTPTLYNTHVKDIGPGINLFSWTTYNGLTIVADTMAVVNNKVRAISGDNVHTCLYQSSIVATQPKYGTGQWSVLPGENQQIASTLTNSEVSGLKDGENRFVWTVTKEECVQRDTISVFVYPAPKLEAKVLAETEQGNDGAIDLTVQSALPIDSTNWDNGQLTEDISGLAAGTYTVRVMANAPGCQTTDSFEVVRSIITHTQNLTKAATALTVQPNPSKGVFTLKATALPQGELSYVVFDLSGREILNSGKLSPANGRLEQTLALKLADGSYHMFLMSNKEPIGWSQLIISKH